MSDAVTFTAFFYGTLLHPSILRRVIGHDGDELQICPALLLEHTRHQIKYADYPAVIPYRKSRQLFSRDLSSEERTVRGTLVRGLSNSDVQLLDVFEGDQYTRASVPVHPLGSFVWLHASIFDPSVAPLTAPPLPPLDLLSPGIPAQTYVWAQPLSDLSPSIWEYADFVRENAWKWVRDGARGNTDYIEVDRRRAMNGNTARREVFDIEGQDDKTEKTFIEVSKTPDSVEV